MIIEFNGMPIQVELDKNGNIVKAVHAKTGEPVSEETAEKLNMIVKRIAQKNPKLFEQKPNVSVSEKQEGNKTVLDVNTTLVQETSQNTQKSMPSNTKKQPETLNSKPSVPLGKDGAYGDTLVMDSLNPNIKLLDVPLLNLSTNDLAKMEQLRGQRNVPGATNPAMNTGNIPRQATVISRKDAERLSNPIYIDDNHVLSNGVLYRMVGNIPPTKTPNNNNKNTGGTKKKEIVDTDKVEIIKQDVKTPTPPHVKPITYPAGTDTGTDIYDTFKPVVAEMSNNWRSATELSGLGQMISTVGQKILYNLGRDAYMRKKIESALKEQAPERYRGDVGKKQLQEDTEKYLKIARESFDERTGEYKRPITPAEKAAMESRAEMANIQKQYQVAKVSELLSKAGLQKAQADKYAWEIVEGSEMLPYEKALKGAEIQRRKVEAYKESELTPYEKKLKEAQANYYQSRADNPNAGQSGGYTLEQFLEAFRAMQDANKKNK